MVESHVLDFLFQKMANYYKFLIYQAWLWAGWTVIALRFKYNWIAEKNVDRNLD